MRKLSGIVLWVWETFVFWKFWVGVSGRRGYIVELWSKDKSCRFWGESTWTGTALNTWRWFPNTGCGWSTLKPRTAEFFEESLSALWIVLFKSEQLSLIKEKPLTFVTWMTCSNLGPHGYLLTKTWIKTLAIVYQDCVFWHYCFHRLTINHMFQSRGMPTSVGLRQFIFKQIM